MAEVVPNENKRLPPGFELYAEGQKVLHEGSQHPEEKSEGVFKEDEPTDPFSPKVDSHEEKNNKSKPDRFYQAPGYRKLSSPVSPASKDGLKTAEEHPPQKINVVGIESSAITDLNQPEIDDKQSTDEKNTTSSVIARVKIVWKKKLAPAAKTSKLKTPSRLTTTAKEPSIYDNVWHNIPLSSASNVVAEQSRIVSTKPRDPPPPIVGKKKIQAKKQVDTAANQAQTKTPRRILGRNNCGKEQVFKKAEKNCGRLKTPMDILDKLSQEEDASKDNLEDIPLPSGLKDDWESRYDNDTLEDPASQKQRAYASKFLENSTGFKCRKNKSAPGKLIIDSKVMEDYGRVYNSMHLSKKSTAQNAGRDQAFADVITMIDGDLFSSSCSLAHCVSADMTMSSGIAVEFRRRFGHVAELLDQRKFPGDVAILKLGERFIYYLVSKELYMTKPVGVTVLSKCLVIMKEHCLEKGVTQLAMPKIGCCRDQLQWSQVSACIVEIFAGSGIQIYVYTMQEQALPWSRKRPAPTPLLLIPSLIKMPKFDWMPAPTPQELQPARPLVVTHQFGGNILTPLQTAITRVFLGCCDGAPQGSAAILLSDALKIWPDYLKHERKLGEFVPVLAGKVCALVCRQNSTALIDFSALYKAAKGLANFAKIVGITNLMFEGFVEYQDNVVTFKVLTLLRLAFHDHYASLTVVWPVEPPYGNIIRASQQKFLNRSQNPPQTSMQN